LYLRNQNTIVATTMVFYDAFETAGIYMVCVNKNMRKKGLGEMVMQKTLQSIRYQKYSNIVLQATKMALPLYKKFNFNHTGVCNLLYKVK
jgi:predicted GNAT family N-acyltransferase